MQVTGLVTKLNMKTKTAAGKVMRSPAYSILLDDSTWYNFGFDSPTCSEGDVITFQATESTYGMEAKFDSVKVETGGGKVGGAQTAVQKAVAGGDARQESIVYQSSLKTATELIGIALANECLVLPTKKADRLPALVASVREVAQDLASEAIRPDFSAFGEPEATDTPVNDE